MTKPKTERRQCCGSCARWCGDDTVTYGECGKEPALTTEWNDGMGCDYYQRWEKEAQVQDWQKHVVQKFEVGQGTLAVQTLREIGTDRPSGILVSVAQPGHKAGDAVPDDYAITGPAVAFMLAGESYEDIVSGLLVLAETLGELAKELVDEMEAQP